MRRVIQLGIGLVACAFASGAFSQIIHGTGVGHPGSIISAAPNDPNSKAARLFVSLTNADGSPVTGLKATNFVVNAICDVSIWRAKVLTNHTNTNEVFPGEYYISVTTDVPASYCDGYIVNVGDRAPIGSVVGGNVPLFTQRGSFVVRTTSPMPMRTKR